MKVVSILTLLTAVTLVGSGCASIHHGVYAVPVDEKGAELDSRETPLGLVISVRKDRVYSDEHFTFMHVTLENRTNDWVRIREAYLDFGDQAVNQSIMITSGQDIVAWHEATEERIRVEEFNRASFLAVLGTIGAIAAHSDSDGVAALGAFTYLGAATSLSVMDIQSDVRQIQNTKIFPENHLLAGDIHIPPGAFARKFILFHTRDPKIRKQFRQFYLTYQTELGQAETVRATFIKKRRSRRLHGRIN